MRAPLLLPFLCLAAWPIEAAAATLRTATTLEHPQVRVSDLFDDAGTAAPRVLGSAPPPGERIIVEAAQAAAIARQFGVAWRPASGAERVVIDRPGRLIARDEVVGVLRTALAGIGAPNDANLELPGFASPLVAMEATPLLAIEQVDYDSSSGRFTATLAITTQGEPLQRMRLSGRLQEMMDVAVPTRRLAAGVVVQPGDLQMMRVRALSSRGEVVRDPAQAIGKAVQRIAVAGQPLPLSDLARPMVVLKGARLLMLLQSPGLSLSAVGRALEPGGMGDQISVLNPVSGAIVQAEIVAPDQVRVAPETLSRPAVRAGTTQVSLR